MCLLAVCICNVCAYAVCGYVFVFRGCVFGYRFCIWIMRICWLMVPSLCISLWVALYFDFMYLSVCIVYVLCVLTEAMCYPFHVGMSFFGVSFHHGGAFVRDPDLVYRGGSEHVELNVDVHKWSYFEAIEILKELGYADGIRLWWRVDGPKSHEGYRAIISDADALELGDFAIKNRCEAQIFVEHVESEVVGSEELLPRVVQGKGNEQVVKDGSGKNMEVERKVEDTNVNVNAHVSVEVVNADAIESDSNKDNSNEVHFDDSEV